MLSNGSNLYIIININDKFKKSVRSGTIRNLASAKVSVPPQIVEKKNE